MQILTDFIIYGWLDTIKQCKKETRPYFIHRTDLTLFHILILRERIVVLAQLRTNIRQKLHAGHQGQEKCKCRVRVSVFGAGINKDIERVVQDCNFA